MREKIRIAVGGYCHETNRFGLVPVSLEVLLRSGCEKERYFKVNRGIKSYCGGFIDEAEALGVDWQTKKLVALKSSQHFRGWWGDKVERIISCDPPGTQSADLKTFDFQHADTTYYPLQDAEFKE